MAKITKFERLDSILSITKSNSEKSSNFTPKIIKVMIGKCKYKYTTNFTYAIYIYNIFTFIINKIVLVLILEESISEVL